MIKKLLNRIIQTVLAFLRKVYYLIARIFIAIGSSMLKSNKKYLFISSTIENLLGSIEIYLKVRNVEEYPLYIRFVTEISSSNDDKISWIYFIKELVYQLGCFYTDIDFKYEKANKKNNIYYINITKTAISNLEKGTTAHIPLVFEEKNTEWLINKALELAAKEEISPELLEKKLQIGTNHSEELYDQLKKIEVLSHRSKDRSIN